MKRIAIVTNKMVCGGVESALIGMLRCIDKNAFDVTVIVMKHGGEWEDRLPEDVRVKFVEPLNNPKAYIKRLFIKGRFLTAIRKALLIRKSIGKDYYEEQAILSRFLPTDEESFDIAIAYHAPGTLPVHYVVNNITTGKKLLWIHGDIEKTKCNTPLYRELYERFDGYVCVSKQSKEVFLRCFPQFEEKTCVFYNYLDCERIESLAKEITTANYDICTVARLSEEKGIDLAILSCKILKDQGYAFKWVCCGTGPEEEKLFRMIEDNDVSDLFFLVGEQNNPYQFIENSTIYVQPSRHEGYCVALAEARYLEKPIVATDFTGSKEQLINGKTGSIVHINEYEIAEAIKTLIDDNDLRENYKNNLRKEKNKRQQTSSINELLLNY